MRVLVIQLARFGDLVQTRRLMLSLCADPGAEVHLCLDRSLAGLAAILYPGVVLHPVVAHGTALAALAPSGQVSTLLEANIPAFRHLAGTGFDLVYNLNFSPLNFRLASLFDPDRVRGHVWRNGQEDVGQWARLAMRWSAMRRIGLNIADFWAWHHPAPVPPEVVNPAAQGRGGGLGVVLAGRESRRSLPPRELAGLVASLVSQRGSSTLTLLGSASESRVAHQLLRELPPRLASSVTNLSGKTDYADLCHIVGGLDLLVTPDTGTMHLAAALGTPVLATFLSSAWCWETGPYGLGHRVLQAVTDCLPCLESQPCGRGVSCLRPFGAAQLARYLSTSDPLHLPEDLLDLDSALDGLGATFSPRAGTDADAPLRGRFRVFLSRHLGAGGCWRDAPVPEFAERMYAERDWMPPDTEAAHSRFAGVFWKGKRF